MIVIARASATAYLFMFTGIFFLAGTNSAYAYLDPGVGSMLLQVILGGAAGVAVIFKLYWRKVLALFGRRQDGDIGAPSSELVNEPVKKRTR